MGALRAAQLWSPVVLLGAIYFASRCKGQGFKASESRVVGASNSYQQLQQLYSNSRSWTNSYKLDPASACSSSRSKSLCAEAAADVPDAYAQLMLAASPQVYSSMDPTNTGGVKLVAPAMDQRSCDTCSAFNVASAAETAIASVYRVNVAECSISVQALHFCPPGNQPARSCKGGWSISSTLTLLQQYSQQLPTEDCMHYNPDQRGDLGYSELCSSSCTAPNQYASQGRFNTQQITSIWEAQRQIRQYGSVVTRFDIMDDFRPFFSSFANAQSVYKPKPGAQYSEGHAVVLVGYNNVQQYWIAKNSWGDGWADNGFFKVAFGVCSILTGDSGEAYGISWEPKETSNRALLNVTPGPKAGCYWYKARGGDYISRVAWLAGILLDKFMIDNAGYVKDLDAPLDGISLLLCNPKQGRFVIAQTSTQTAGSWSASDPQLESLLRIKSLIDKADHLTSWTRESGENGGYCRAHHFLGVYCHDDMVTWINLHNSNIGNVLQGTLPPASTFSGLAGLTNLSIADQQGISGTIPSDWSQMKLLEHIWVSNNSLTGTVPAPWGSLSKLKILYLWGNKLTGQIPGAYKGLTALEQFGLSSNQLASTIPVWLGDLKQLKVLYLHHNRLTGPVPDSLGGLALLQEMQLNDNQLSGSIPASLGNLHKLRVLYLWNNNFVGTIPTSWASMTGLKDAGFTGNPGLGGCLPRSWSGKLEKVSYSYNTKIKGFC